MQSSIQLFSRSGFGGFVDSIYLKVDNWYISKTNAAGSRNFFLTLNCHVLDDPDLLVSFKTIKEEMPHLDHVAASKLVI
jgi:hypothetical protein